jgi:hypothetical protein
MTLDTNDQDLKPETIEATAVEQAETSTTETTPKTSDKVAVGFDLFNWANNIERFKKELDMEVLVINKHFTPFRLNLDRDLDNQTRTIFLYELVNFINKGAEVGLEVRQFELEEASKDVVLYTTLNRVERASYLLDFLKNRYGEVVDFNNNEHEFRLMKAIVVKFTHKAGEVEPFYIIKQLASSQAVSGTTAWQINSSKVEAFASDVSLKPPLDNQMLLVDNQIFVFNQAKFERLFNYDYKKQLVAEEKVRAIEQNFKLSFPEGVSMNMLIKERKKTLAKIQKLDVDFPMNQEELIEYADEMQLELMTDDQGAIIILDGNDLDMFIGLLNEDYMVSTVTNRRYEITAKKAMNAPEGEPPRG